MDTEEHEAMLRKAAQAHQLSVIGIESVMMQLYGRKKHMNEVSKNGKLSLLAKTSRIIQVFHVVHLQRRLRLCVFCPMFMKLSVRTILLWLQGRNQSSRKLRHLREGRCRKVSTLTRNLQGLVQHQCSHPAIKTSSMGSTATRSISSTGTYSHDSRTSTSSTSRGTSKADANGESDDQQASS